MAEISPNLAKAINLQIQKAEQTPKEQPPKFMPRHIIVIIINFLKTKDRKNLEQQERNEILSVRGKQFELLQISHQKSWKPENIVVLIQRMLCHILLVSVVPHHGKKSSALNPISREISFRNEEEVKTFPNEGS